MNAIFRAILPLLTGAALLGCAGSQPPAESTKDADEKAAEPAGDSSAVEEEEAVAEEAKQEVPSGPSAKDVITSAETTFVLDFIASELGEKTEERCRKDAGEDMKKFAHCKRKVQDKLGMPMVKFEEKDGKWWWLTFDRKGSKLITLHKVEFELGEETKDSLTIHPKGRDQGSRPQTFPPKVVVKLPNDSTIEIDDPTHGRMTYRARIGILEQTEK